MSAKQDRALQLSEQGLDANAIAERLGVKRTNVHEMIKRARHQRDKWGRTTEDETAA